MEYKERTAATQAQEYIQDLIQFRPATKFLPSQREIAEELGVSRNAVLHALVKLKSADQVSTKERTGIVVNTKININMLGMESMTAEINDRTIQINHLTTELISVPKNLTNFFGPTVKKLIKISRVRLKNKIPLTYETTYFNAAKFTEFAEIDFTNKSLYALLKDKYGIVLAYGKENIACSLVNEKISEILKVKKDIPLYRIDSFNYLEDATPIEATTQYLIGSKFKYHFTATDIYTYL